MAANFRPLVSAMGVAAGAALIQGNLTNIVSGAGLSAGSATVTGAGRAINGRNLRAYVSAMGVAAGGPLVQGFPSALIVSAAGHAAGGSSAQGAGQAIKVPGAILKVESSYTGGAIIIETTSQGAYVLSRSTNGGPFGQIAAGNNLGVFIDVGEGLPGPLDPTSSYTYRLTNNLGAFTSDPVVPASQVALKIEPLTMTIQRLLQGAINGMVSNNTLPEGVRAPDKVLLAMPIGGLPSFPIITINLDLLQQDQVPIGQSFPHANQVDGSYVLYGLAKRVWTISVLAADAITRDFYREAVVRWWLVFGATVFNKIGQNVTHRYQVASGQVAKDEKMPGFYYADMMVELIGNLNVTISPDYGRIETIDVRAFHNDDDYDEVIVTAPPLPGSMGALQFDISSNSGYIAGVL